MKMPGYGDPETFPAGCKRPWDSEPYLTAPCDNEDCRHKDTSRSGCRKHSRHMVSTCEFYKPEPAGGEDGY